MSLSEQQEKPYQQQQSRVSYLAICFMIIFTAFNSLQNMISTLFDQKGLHNLGPFSLGLLYFIYAFASFYANKIYEFTSIKTVLMFSSISYVLFALNALVIQAEIIQSKQFIWISTLAATLICGVGSSFMWVSQGIYISLVTSHSRKTQFFGLFYGIFTISSLLAGSFASFLLGLFTPSTYLFGIFVLGIIGSLLLSRIDNLQTIKSSQEFCIFAQVRAVISMVFDSSKRIFRIYQCSFGFIQAIVFSFMYKIVLSIFEGNIQINTNLYISLITFGNGFGSVATGFILNKCLAKKQIPKLIEYSIITSIMALSLILLSYITNSYMLLMSASFCCGSLFSSLRSCASAFISTYYPDNLIRQMLLFSVLRCLTSSLIFLVIILLNDMPIAVILLSLMFFIFLYIKKAYIRSQNKQSLIQLSHL